MFRCAVLPAFVHCALAADASAQWQLSSADGDTIRLGYLMQARAEWEQVSSGAPTAQNLFLRHARVLLAGKLHTPFSFFIGTDTPNMGKSQVDGTKNNGAIGIYDAWVTYEPGDAFKVDMGLIGTPNSHNSIQSISGMLAQDFGAYAFVSTPPTGSRAGRDYGLQARGYFPGQHVEYRAGAFQGYRGMAADKQFRYVGRLVVDAYSAERSVYYSGTTLGVRKNLAVGVSVDHQERYNGVGGDVYFDHPVNRGDDVTLQLDVVHYDGGVTLPDFPRQRTVLVEAGYYSKAIRLAPFFQFSGLDYSADSLRDERRWIVGVGYFARGHRLNIKADYGRTQRTGLAGGSLVQLTLQTFEL